MKVIKQIFNLQYLFIFLFYSKDKKAARTFRKLLLPKRKK